MSSTGQALGYVVGAVVGYFVGPQGGMMVGAALGGAVGAALDPPKGPKLYGPRLSDLSQQGASYGTPIPRFYGSVPVHGNIFWIENNALKETSSTTSSGGKGGGGGASTTTYQYSATFALGLGEGPISGVRRIWINGDLIYNAGAGDMESIIASNKAAQGFTIYTGSETQLANPRMQATLGVANTPAYRGLAYIVFYDLALEKYGNTLAGAQVKVELVSRADYSVPTLHSSISYLGTLNYASEGYFQTAEVGTGRFDLTAGLYYGQCTFRDYDYQGNILGVRIIEHPVNKSSGNDSFTYHKTCIIHDRPNGFFACCIDEYRISVYPGSAQITLNNAALSTVDSYKPYSEAGGYFWFPSASAATRISADLSSYTTYVISGADHQSINIKEDQATGRLFVRYRLEFDNSGWFGEFHDLPSSLDWSYLLGIGMAYDISGRNHFSVYDDRLCLSNTQYFAGFPNGKLTVFSIGASTLSVLGEINNVGSGMNVFSLNNVFSISSGNIYRLTDSMAVSAYTLGEIVLAETLKAKALSAGDVDTTSLTDDVLGYRVTAAGAIRAAIEPLQGAYPFDAIQSGYKIKYLRRGVGSSVATIAESDLDARGAGGKHGTRLSRVREMDSQLPVLVTVSFLDADREYDVGEQYAERLNIDSVNMQTTEMAIVMTATEALQKAETLLYMYWLERYEFSFTLPPTFRHLEPSDIVTVSAGGDSFTLRLVSIQYMADGLMECTARLNNASTYSSSAIGANGIQSTGLVPLPGKSFYELLDIPTLIDVGDTPGYAVAMSGYTSAWVAGTLYRSSDGGATWSDTNTFTQPSTQGWATTTLSAPADSRLFDNAGALNVKLFGGQTLSSVTEAALFSGANHFAYGADGRWEIIAAKNAVLQGDGSYTLTNLLRGRFGTEWAVGSHTGGDKLVLLGRQSLQWCAASLNAIGIGATFRAISSSAAFDSDTDRAFTYRGVNLKCLSPVWINGNRHPTSNDWTLTWVRRTRLGGEWIDGVDVSLGESSAAYEIDIFSASDYATVKRTISGLTSASATYTSAQQLADFGSNQATLYVKVYQLSANVGRGYPLTTSITR